MRKLLLVFLTACGTAQMHRPVDVLGKGTVCRPVNEGWEVCIDPVDAVWDCRFYAGRGWGCRPR